MRIAWVPLALAAILAAACSSTASHPAAHAPRPPAVHLTTAQQTRECAALDLVRMGYSTYGAEVTTVAGQYSVSQHNAQLIIAAAIRDRCPSEVSVIPAGDPLP